MFHSQCAPARWSAQPRTCASSLRGAVVKVQRADALRPVGEDASSFPAVTRIVSAWPARHHNCPQLATPRRSRPSQSTAAFPEQADLRAPKSVLGAGSPARRRIAGLCRGSLGRQGLTPEWLQACRMPIGNGPNPRSRGRAGGSHDHRCQPRPAADPAARRGTSPVPSLGRAGANGTFQDGG